MFISKEAYKLLCCFSLLSVDFNIMLSLNMKEKLVGHQNIAFSEPSKLPS